MILAGETSGDLHGSRLTEALRQHQPEMELTGMGSDKMRNAGVNLIYDCKNIAVVGLVEVLRHWPEIKRALAIIENSIKNNPPDLLILIDYVEFNLRMAAVAKQIGVKVLFYVSPQVWAWRPERIHKIGSVIDMMAVIFPFEVEYYQRAGIPVRYVGHPLSGKVVPSGSRDSLRKTFHIPKGKKVVGLLPGSRNNEIRYILPELLSVARLLNRQRDDIEFLLPLAPNLPRKSIEQQIRAAKLNNIQVLHGQAYDVMVCADCIAIASGTATLEAALIGVPMAIVYKVSAISWLWMRRKLQITNVGLANIVAGREIVPEFIQEKCKPVLIAREIARQLDDDLYQQSMRDAQADIRSILGDKDAAQEVAALAMEMLGKTIQLESA